MSATDLKKRINELIVRKTGFPIDEIRPGERLLHDLGIIGDDAAELLTEIAGEFDVDLEGFPFDRFFPGEPHLLNFWKYWHAQWNQFLPLTVEDLYRLAQEKRFVHIPD